jgi:hypothetical protein
MRFVAVVVIATKRRDLAAKSDTSIICTRTKLRARQSKVCQSCFSFDTTQSTIF